MKRNILLITMFIALLAGSYYMGQLDGVDESLIIPGDITQADPTKAVLDGLAPPFTLKDTKGNEVNLVDYRGKGVILNFWATWSPFSADEMPLFEKVSQEHTDEIVVLAINRKESAEKADVFASNLGLTFPLLLDTTDRLYSLYNGRSMPATFFIDHNGVIVDRVYGPLTEKALNQKVEDLLTKMDK